MIVMGGKNECCPNNWANTTREYPRFLSRGFVLNVEALFQQIGRGTTLVFSKSKDKMVIVSMKSLSRLESHLGQVRNLPVSWG